MSYLATVVLEQHEELAPLLMPPIGFAGIAAAVFILLAAVAFSYRDVANRHRSKGESGDGATLH